MVKSHILAANAQSRFEILEGKKKSNIIANEFIPCLKRGRSIGFKDKNPIKQKLQQIDDGTLEILHL